MNWFTRNFYSAGNAQDVVPPIQGFLDLPSTENIADPMNFGLQGWVRSLDSARRISRIDFTLDGELIGETTLTQARTDVAAVHDLDLTLNTGFSCRLTLPAHARKTSALLAVWTIFDNGDRVELTRRTISLAPLRGFLELPTSDLLADVLTFRIQGWVQSTLAERKVVQVCFALDGEPIGETRFLHTRVDVAEVHKLEPTARIGFLRVLSLPTFFSKTSALLSIEAVFENGDRFEMIARKISLGQKDYRKIDYGHLLEPSIKKIQKRNDIFGSGSSREEGSQELVALLHRELGEEYQSILDVGCGLGYYGRGLLASGYNWMGVEMKKGDALRLAEAGLPHVLASGYELPFADRSYDATICIEVLEHIEDLPVFLKELARVVRRRVLISVPNAELIPYLSPYLAVPWHMLEGDHKNFFTRASLEALLLQFFAHVEVQLYGEYPLRSVEGQPLHYHLFAIAECA